MLHSETDTFSHRQRHALRIATDFRLGILTYRDLVRFLLPFRVHTEQNVVVLLNERTFECKFPYFIIIF